MNPLFSINSLVFYELTEFEKDLIDIMVNECCMMSEALDILFKAHEVDTKNVIDLVDFLEEMVYDLNKVQMMMSVYTGQISDFYLRKNPYDEKPQKKDDKG